MMVLEGLPLVLVGRLECLFPLPKRRLVPTQQLPLDGVVGHLDRERLEIRDIDERARLELECARESVPLAKPLAVVQVVGELDGNIDIRPCVGVCPDPRAEGNHELDGVVLTQLGLADVLDRIGHWYTKWPMWQQAFPDGRVRSRWTWIGPYRFFRNLGSCWIRWDGCPLKADRSFV
ncbi:MAG: hypothetical protein U5K37_08525 [Natrialbaceae archaeon]|nr:hypothetical protein [Natrialbaceae archaeon]